MISSVKQMRATPDSMLSVVPYEGSQEPYIIVIRVITFSVERESIIERRNRKGTGSADGTTREEGAAPTVRVTAALSRESLLAHTTLSAVVYSKF